MATGQATIVVGQSTGFRELPFAVGSTISGKSSVFSIPGEISYGSLYFDLTTLMKPTEAPVLEQLGLGPEGLTYLMHLKSPDYRLVRPIMLSVQSSESGKVVTRDSHVHMYGVGESKSEALVAYESMLLDYFEDLIENHDTISDYLSQQLAWMLGVIEKV